MKYDKDKIKEELTIQQVFKFCEHLGGEPKMDPSETFFTARTICHNGESHKLYYYENSHLCQCFTNCGSFDIFQLYINVKKTKGIEVDLPSAVEYIASYFNLVSEEETFIKKQESEIVDWKILQNYNKIHDIDKQNRKVELKFFNEKVLANFPFVRYSAWEAEGISFDIMRKRNIRYDPAEQAIIIPHYDINGNLIGIRSRTTIEEEEIYGKYKPSVLGGKMYNHPLGFSLYGLNWNKNQIKAAKTAIVVEGEKSVLKSASYFGEENDLFVAVCGSSLTQYQVDLLLSLGVTEIVIAFDKQWQKKGDEEFKKWTNKLIEINKKYGSKVLITFVFDKEGTVLEYKMSPIDKGPEIFMELFKERIKL